MPRAAIAAFVVCAAASAVCSRLAGPDGPPAPAADVFTPAHATVGAAVLDFFGVRPLPQQPMAFPHNTHIAKGLKCTEYCHESAAKGPIAGLPSVKTCMICHEAIAPDRPLIQTVADYSKRRIEIPWQRVYGYPAESHVRFQHAPHVRANVDCATCHGRVSEQTVAERTVDLSMDFCVSCHKAKEASNDCLTCHF